MTFIIFLLLAASFCTNCFSIVPEEFYRSHGADPEALVVGRLLETESYGLASNTGFLIHNGYVDTFRQFRAGGRPIRMTEPYLGNAGLQGWILSGVDLLLYKAQVGAVARLASLRALVAVALAAVLALWIYLFALEFGSAAALASGLVTLYSPWLAVFADNLYWVPVTWFVPAVLTWYWAVSQAEGLRWSSGRFYVLHGAAVLAKALCGFEYISAVVGASGAALLYGVCKRGGTRSAVRPCIAFCISVTVALASAFLIQIFLMSVHYGSFSEALSDFIGRVQYRSTGAEGIDGELAISLEVSLERIFTTYLYGTAVVNVPGLRSFDASEIFTILLVPFVLGITYTTIRDRSFHHTLALGLLVCGSIAAAVSWHSIARGHSVIHTFLNYVLWSVPALIVLPAASARAFAQAFLQTGQASPRAVVVVLGTAIAWMAYWSPLSARYLESLGASADAKSIRGQRITLRISGRAIEGSFRCDKADLTHPFFVQLSTPPSDVVNGGSERTANHSFAYRTKAVTTELNEIRYGTCTFALEAREPIAGLSVGQFTEESESAVEWKEEFRNLLQPRFPYSVRVFDLTDANWLHGVRRGGPMLLIENRLETRQALSRARRACAGEQCRKIQSVSFQPWPYIWLTLDSPLEEPVITLD